MPHFNIRAKGIRFCSEDGYVPVNMLKIPGTIGDNTTKASLGGLECSTTDYIIAGNSVDMTNYDSSTVRNIFVASVSKYSYASETPKLTYLTEYKDSSVVASTPVLVKTGSDRFILMWFENDGSYRVIDDEGKSKGKVYYTELNGHGEQVGRIYSMDACLFDCKPVIINSRLTEIGKDAFGRIAKKASFNVPNKLADKYRKMLINSGADESIRCK